MLYIVFNNKNSLEDLGLGILKNNEHYRVVEEIEYVNIEGRKNGNLTIKTGNFKDIVIKRVFRIIDGEDYNLKILKINDWIDIIQNDKLYFSDYPERCYIVKNAQIKKISDDNRNIFDIEIEFYCEPFLRETNEEFEVVTSGQTIYNLGDFESEPTVELSINGTNQTVFFEVGTKRIEVRGIKGNLNIDSSLFRTVSEEIEVRNAGNFPVLEKGENVIKFSSNVVTAKIKKNTLYRR